MTDLDFDQALRDLVSATALEIIKDRFPETKVDPGRRHNDRPAIGGFRSHADAMSAVLDLPDASAYTIPANPDRVGRWWLVPVERYAKPGYLLSGPWNDYAPPKWVG